MRSDTLRRRKFLQIAASAASAAAASCGGRSGPWRVFSAAEADTADAICDRIIPPDDTGGAKSAGVVNYIDRQLNGRLRKYQRIYLDGLAGIERLSRSKYGKRFSALSGELQDRLLSAAESGKTPAGIWKPADARDFFETIRDHTMQGFYGDPRHGGNREYASWRMLDIPPAPVRGRQLYDLSGAGLTDGSRRLPWRSRG